MSFPKLLRHPGARALAIRLRELQSVQRERLDAIDRLWAEIHILSADIETTKAALTRALERDGDVVLEGETLSVRRSHHGLPVVVSLPVPDLDAREAAKSEGPVREALHQ